MVTVHGHVEGRGLAREELAPIGVELHQVVSRDELCLMQIVGKGEKVNRDNLMTSNGIRS
jgi:hypothetical protein